MKRMKGVEFWEQQQQYCREKIHTLMYANLLILCVQEHGLQICKAEFVVSTGTMLANSYKTKVVGGSVPGSFSLQVKVLDTH